MSASALPSAPASTRSQEDSRNERPTTTMRTPRDVVKHREEREARKRNEALMTLSQGQEPAADGAVSDVAHPNRTRDPLPPAPSRSQPRGDRPSRRPGPIDHQSVAPITSTDMLAASQALLDKTQPQASARQQTNHLQSRRVTTTALSRPTAPSGASAAAARRKDQGQRSNNTSSFPHAFERWENLSAHWEGLTSFWLHKLEENRQNIEHLVPSGAAMSRQITDLSAAGANLFHAVVELQRLRASSERKFQRWFLEVRQERERIEEARAISDGKLQAERSAHCLTQATLSRMQMDRNLAEKRVSELTRELFINKDESRRAWEELGRREVEERDRTMSLRDGLPTVVGGVQVVPMHASGAISQLGGESQRPSTAEHQERSQLDQFPNDTYRQSAPSPSDTDPFTESGRPQVATYHQREPLTTSDPKAAAVIARLKGREQERPSTRGNRANESDMPNQSAWQGGSRGVSGRHADLDYGDDGEYMTETATQGLVVREQGFGGRDDLRMYQSWFESRWATDSPGLVPANPEPSSLLSSGPVGHSDIYDEHADDDDSERVHAARLVASKMGQSVSGRDPAEDSRNEAQSQAEAAETREEPNTPKPSRSGSGKRSLAGFADEYVDNVMADADADDDHEWDDVSDTRHHHPTRLGEIMEEDDGGRPRSSYSVM